jgi:hypothetical protein
MRWLYERDMKELAAKIEADLKAAKTTEEIVAAIRAMKPLIDQIPWGREVVVYNDGTSEVIFKGMPK